MTARRGAAVRVALLVVLALALTGCQLRTELNISVDPDGSGRVELALGLDDEAVTKRPDLVDELDFADLTKAGWEVSGPTKEADGTTWIRARHRFGTPDELGALVDEIAGENGPFRDFSLTRDDGFADTTYRFGGTVDFAAGLDQVTDDPELADALGAEPKQLLEERLGAAVDQLVKVQVAVRLPGDVESNAATRASNGAVWRPSVLEHDTVELHATGTVRRSERWVLLGVAVAAGVVLVLFLLIRLVLWRRRRAAAASS